MQFQALALLAVVVATPLTAQSNPFIVFPQDPERETITSSSYVRRPDWNLEAEGFQEISTDYFRGVGDTGGQAMARGFYHWCGDLETLTAETYGIILRTEDPLGGPDTTPAGVIIEVSNLTTPIGTGGNQGWIMTDVFATPAALPTNATWFQGLHLPQNLAWPSGTATGVADGHSIWCADTLTQNSPSPVGENAILGAPAVTWASTPTPATFTTEWTYIMGTLVDNPTLHVGGIDPNSARTGVLGAPSYGMAGMFPDITGAPRSDGLELRIQDNLVPGGIAVFAGSLGWWAGGGVPLGYGGDLYLDLPGVVLIGAAIANGGAATMPFAAPGTLAPSLIGVDVMFQGLMLDPVTLAGRMSNAQTTSL